ncbi:iron complex transport system ATP-binding protein [Rhodoligotrophos appendicifer]|uniref:heme ABC transporter ATP-binding protein n=1 Tax=Rhodoligotrophos appendicifer TaxID=987056 RepID=UPI001184A8ED|nr:heme ABC transporter ATP-binding protein [Rhodoligotrophos appendicifer]
MIEAKAITVRRGESEILSSVSVQVMPGELTIVLGPNGAGKSTLLAALVGDLLPVSGSITFDGRPLHDFRKGELALRRAVLPQKSHLAFPFTVREVVELGLVAIGTGRGRSHAEVVREALARVGLSDYAARYYQQLSGGEQQRVHIARICCQLAAARSLDATPYLFLDEPVSNLDLRHQLETLDIARDFADQGGGAFAILHDVNLASLYADRLVIIDKGRVAASGAPAETLTTEIISRVFNVPVEVNRMPRGERPFLLPHTARD